MRYTTEYKCHWCDGTEQVVYCHKCRFLSCNNCIKTVEVIQWFCPHCNMNVESEFCGVCGSEAKLLSKELVPSCSNCGSTQLSDPKTLINNIPSDYFSAISEVSEIIPELEEIYRSLNFFITLARLCRLAGLMAFPQVEQQLTKCSTGLSNINQRGINQLMKFRKEGLFEIRNIKYFSEIDIDNYRSAERIINSASEIAHQFTEMMSFWINEVEQELNKLYSYTEPLRQHYELLSDIKRFLPEGVYNVAAVVSPVSVNIKQNKKGRKDLAYIIFAEDEIIFLPKQVLDKKYRDKIITGTRISYDDLVSYHTDTSPLKGYQLIIKLNDGEIIINASPVVIDAIIKYYDLIKNGEPFIVGSAKEILKIEAELPDKNEFKRAVNKFINIFRERLFGTNVVNEVIKPKFSIKNLKKEYLELKHRAEEIDLMAKNLNVDVDEYQSYRSEISNSLTSIRENFKKLGGHLTEHYDVKKWLDEDDSDSFSSPYPKDNFKI